MTKERIRFTLRIPDNIYEKLNTLAKKQGVSCNSLISTILFDYVNKKEHKHERITNFQ